jgi:hypothetical protein
MTGGTPGTAGGKAPGAELASMRIIPGLRAGSDPLQPRIIVSPNRDEIRAGESLLLAVVAA